MSKKYIVYRIKTKSKEIGDRYREYDVYHKLIVQSSHDTLEEAELAISKLTKYIQYTILPVFYQTDFD